MSQNNESLEINVDEIKSKTKKGLVSLFSRSALIYILRIISVIFLSRSLSPEDYGVFGVLNSWIWGINLILPDLSMCTALIQQKSEPTKDQMRNMYGVSLYRGICIVLLVLLFGHFVIEYHKFDSQKYLMFLALSFFIFFDCLKPPLRMMTDRNLDFQKVVIVEVTETIVMYLVQITSAWIGMGAWSFVFATLSRSIVGFLLYLYYQKKLYLPVVSLFEIKKLFHYEFMVQIKTVIVGIRGMIIPIVLGRILIPNDLGIVMWTIGIASIPVILVHNYDRVLFPTLSRLYGNQDEFRNVATKAIGLNIAGMGFLFGIIAISTSPAISFFFPHKWADAKLILPICCLAIFLSQVRYLGSSVLNASGKPKTLLKVEAFAIILEFILAIPAVLYYKSSGYFYAVILLEFCICIIMYFVNQDNLHKSTIIRFFSVLTSSLISYLIINKILINKMQSSFYELILTTFTYSIGYLCLLILFDRKFLSEIQYMTRDMKRKLMQRNV